MPGADSTNCMMCRAEFVPSERLDILTLVAKEQQCDNPVAAQAGELNEVQIYAGGHLIHPVISQLLQSRQTVSFFERTGSTLHIEQSDLGFSPVQVLTHSFWWNSDSADADKNISDTNLTRFQKKAELSETNEVYLDRYLV